MGCDPCAPTGRPDHRHFNPRIPYGMRRPAIPGRRVCVDFNPRIPYGMRLADDGVPCFPPVISIHASRMGCDISPMASWSIILYFNPRIPYGMRLSSAPASVIHLSFQSTHPVWDATNLPPYIDERYLISIHASRMGCDLIVVSTPPIRQYFNPRIPYGMRLIPNYLISSDFVFQSTHPVWDATD